MIKKLCLITLFLSTSALADVLPEPGLATPAYTPPAYIPSPSPPPTTNYVVITTPPAYHTQTTSSYYTPLPAMSPQLVYINYDNRFTRQR